MSKVKQWAEDEAEKAVDKVLDKLTKGEIIHYPSVSSDSYYFSNNTNIYPT